MFGGAFEVGVGRDFHRVELADEVHAEAVIADPEIVAGVLAVAGIDTIGDASLADEAVGFGDDLFEVILADAALAFLVGGGFFLRAEFVAEVFCPVHAE